jgi:hypothetical protein
MEASHTPWRACRKAPGHANGAGLAARFMWHRDARFYRGSIGVPLPVMPRHRPQLSG